MVTLDPHLGEALAHFLVRCRETAKRTNLLVSGTFEGVTFFVEGRMTDGELAQAYVDAKRLTIKAS